MLKLSSNSLFILIKQALGRIRVGQQGQNFILPNSGTGQKGLRTPTMWFPLRLFWFAVHLLIFVTFPRQMVDLQVFEWEEKTLKKALQF